MNEPTMTGKRIVSKGEYIQTEINRVSCMVGATILLLLLLPMCLVSMLFGFWSIIILVVSVWTVSGTGFQAGLLLLIASLVLGALIYILWKLSLAGLNYSEKTGDLLPLTRANLAEVPVFETLVRASQEPVQLQENILLRQAMEEQERHQEQLLRASTGGQEKA